MYDQCNYWIFSATTVVAFVTVALWLKRSRGLRFPPVVALCAAAILALGWIPVRKAGDAEVERVRALLVGFAPTYALEMRRLGHARIRHDTGPDDPLFQTLLAAQTAWLKVNPSIVSIYTMRRRADGVWIFIVAAPVDLDRNGVYEGEREQPSFPGDEYRDATDFWSLGLRGITAFDSKPYTDLWGTWVSAVTPLLNDRGEIEAVLGVDYDARTFLRAVAVQGTLVIGALALSLLALLSLTTFIVLHRAHLDELRTHSDLQRQKEVADQANVAKSEFLSNMSHELRTPMHAIMSFAALGVERTKPEAPEAPREKLAHFYKRIEESSTRMVRLLDDLLDLSKLETGKMDYHWERVDLHSEVNAAVSEFAALARGRHVRITVTAAEPFAVRADRGRLGQVIRNLLSNAIKFTAENSIVSIVLAGADQAAEANPCVHLQVRDAGVGIPPAELEAVFDKFVQSTRTKTGAGGTGLGLSIAREIVQQHGGRIWASNNPEGGATFHMILPRHLTEATGSQDQRAAA